jgi:hypothetical protein
MSEIEDLNERNAQLEASLDKLVDRVLAESARWNQERDWLVKVLKGAKLDLQERKYLHLKFWDDGDEEILAQINAALAEIDPKP